jgi:N-dimethylarginine dimethylaminohydrolase
METAAMGKLHRLRGDGAGSATAATAAQAHVASAAQTRATQAGERATLLMCPPEHFSVSYVINPWMDPARWQRDAGAQAAASGEWRALHRTLTTLGGRIELVEPAPGVPDLVFTANAAVVLDRQVLLARFRHAERQREEPHLAAAFRSLAARGLVDAVHRLPQGMVLEGAGDCVHDAARGLFWLGYGPRSDAAARAAVKDLFGCEAVAIELADERFYHMDTALSPLPGGDVMYLPAAFTAAGRATIRDRVARHERIEIGMEDGCRLAANAVALGRHLVMSQCSERLRDELGERGYTVVTTPLSSFLRSGGSAFCLTLRLDRQSRSPTATAAAVEPAA